jgi:predicted outer membrane repeat protein
VAETKINAALSAVPLQMAHAASVRYVKPGGMTSGLCDSWINACALQYALGLAASGDEIWAQAGTYTPGIFRSDTFQLRNGIALYGGFGGTESVRNDRNITANVTVLSGDLLGNDNTNVKYDEPTRADNSYHVVTGTGTDGTAILDGFTISSGNANGDGLFQLDIGGGLCNCGNSDGLSGSPTVRYVIFSNNTASYAGAGLFNWYSSSPTLTNVTFSGNAAKDYGGAMDNYRSANPTLLNVTFVGNTANNGGGLSARGSSSPTLTNVTFSGNSAWLGGAIHSDQNSAPTLINATIVRNTAGAYGGGISNRNTSAPDPTGSAIVLNSIVWGNTAPTNPQIDNDPSADAVVNYSDIQGGYTGIGNTSGDPLLGTLGNYGGSTQTVPILVGSAAIDTADDSYCPATDQRGVTRPYGAHCDMGAFEWDGSALTKRYAKPGGMTSGSCDSWSNACELRYALSIATSGDEIWARMGTYTPSSGTLRTDTFRLKSGVALYGGFVGTETTRDQRNWVTNVTTLSGDIGAPGSSDNSYHVVTGTDTDSTAILDGFTVSGGNANGDYLANHDIGGGMMNGADMGGVPHSGSPTVRNIIFSGNSASYAGAGMFNWNGSNPTLTNVTFNGNTATSYGGGMDNYRNSNPTLTNVTFVYNTAGYGGGLSARGTSSPTLTNVTFSRNTGWNGGALHYEENSNPVLTNVTIVGNTAGNYGGGISNRDPTTAPPTGDATVRNSIIWGNTATSGNPQIDNDTGGNALVTYSDIQGAILAQATLAATLCSAHSATMAAARRRFHSCPAVRRLMPPMAPFAPRPISARSRVRRAPATWARSNRAALRSPRPVAMVRVRKSIPRSPIRWVCWYRVLTASHSMVDALLLLRLAAARVRASRAVRRRLLLARRVCRHRRMALLVRTS